MASTYETCSLLTKAKANTKSVRKLWITFFYNKYLLMSILSYTWKSDTCKCEFGPETRRPDNPEISSRESRWTSWWTNRTCVTCTFACNMSCTFWWNGSVIGVLSRWTSENIIIFPLRQSPSIVPILKPATAILHRRNHRLVRSNDGENHRPAGYIFE